MRTQAADGLWLAPLFCFVTSKRREVFSCRCDRTLWASESIFMFLPKLLICEFVCLLCCSVMLMWKCLLEQKMAFVLGPRWDNAGVFAAWGWQPVLLATHKAGNITARRFICKFSSTCQMLFMLTRVVAIAGDEWRLSHHLFLLCF